MKKMVWIMVIAFAFALAFTACDDKPDPDPTPQTVIYSGTANGITYTLKITGNTYVLTAGSKKSAGTVVSYSNGTFTLKPEGSATTFTASVSSSGLTGFTGGITWEGDSTPTTLPTTVTPNTGNPLEGTWLEANGTTMTIAGNTITITSAGGELFGSGTFTVNNNTITVNFTAGEQAGQTFNGTFSLSINGNTLALSIGGEDTTWIKQGSSGGSPAPKFTGVQVYTLDNGAFTAYSGTGTAMDVKGFMSDNYGQYEELGKIGTISGDGKLTFEVPAIADDKLFLVPTEMGGNGAVKFTAVGIQVHNSDDSYLSSLWLHNSSNTDREVHFVYFDRDFSAMGLSVKKGWNYFESNDDDYSQIIFDISSNHKWVIDHGN